MNELFQKKILIVDCQSTGMHPKTSHLLQIGWSIVDGLNQQLPVIEKWILKLPADYEVPKKIMRMQQISPADLKMSIEPNLVFDNLQKALQSLGPNPMVVAHYAPFEVRFLKQFYLEHAHTEQLNFDIICTQRIAKRLLPNLLSHNLKALSGYFKLKDSPKNEVISHVHMSIEIWQQLLTKLQEIGIDNDARLIHWLTLKNHHPKPCYYEYNIERAKRLELSTKPGVYRMLTKDKTILYVGKATSLKSRVNSYFRGTKNRDRRILEMLAQVWEVETIECETSLQAALLESDEIKKCNPPYNILLKSDSRKIIFYNHDYTEYSEIKDSCFYNGPYKPQDALMIFLKLMKAIKTNQSLTFLKEVVSCDVLKESWRLFLINNHLEESCLSEFNIRDFLVMGYKLLFKFNRAHYPETFVKWCAQEKKNNTEENMSQEQKIAGKIYRIFLRAAETKQKSRHINRLYNSELLIVATQKKITVIDGVLNQDKSDKLLSKTSTKAFEVTHYDRLSILLSAKNKSTVVFA